MYEDRQLAIGRPFINFISIEDDEVFKNRSEQSLHKYLKRGDTWTSIKKANSSQEKVEILHCRNTCKNSKLTKVSEAVNGSYFRFHRFSPLLQHKFHSLGGATIYVTAAIEVRSCSQF